MSRPRLLVLASGTRDGGGSGFETLVKASRDGRLRADIVAVASNHAEGGVRRRAERLNIPFRHFGAPWSADAHQVLVRDTAADFVALSGWLKRVVGLDGRRTFNIHPGPLPDFGGPGFYGHHVHEAVMRAYRAGTITHSAVTMHFVGADYDRGAPAFFRGPVPIRADDDAASLGARVGAAEHRWQPVLTDLVVSGAIAWDGADALTLPPGYRIDAHPTLATA